MNIKRLAIVVTLATTFSLQAVAETNSPNIDVLTGDARTACEVILCLSSANGRGISECQPPIRKYFSIKAKKWKNTVRKRKNFLKLCPSSNESLTDSISNLRDCRNGFSFFRKKCEKQNRDLQNTIDKILRGEK